MSTLWNDLERQLEARSEKAPDPWSQRAFASQPAKDHDGQVESTATTEASLDDPPTDNDARTSPSRDER